MATSICCMFRHIVHNLPLKSKLLHLKLFSMASEFSATGKQFVCQKDRYNGITVETAEITFSDVEFEEILKASLSEWMNNGIRGVWFHVPRSKASYIPILVNHGFEFHHSKASYLMLTKWLPSSEPNLLPQYPHTHIGVGGLVVNEKNEVLVIQEKYGAKAHWKFPGGYANPGEDIADTAKREVLEETGIETEFVELVLFRHHHKHIFECSDIYFVCHMKPIGGCIKKCTNEIAECRWMDINDFQSHLDDVSHMNQFVMKCFLEIQKNEASIAITPVLSFAKTHYQNVYNIIWKQKSKNE
ncbi:uncharacterized protein [Centruroides vittatus]|uniref:uncharacterized protein isoform X1 n=2 Tax=Centruroides vittatus TaxID=120091 RepID=UPI00350F15CB